jgi:tellurite methyltransferase
MEQSDEARADGRMKTKRWVGFRPRGGFVERTISSYQRDEAGDWIAALNCGHNQHVRHNPPFQLRPWVEDEHGRASHVGSLLACPLCDRGEFPDGLRFVRSTPIWDEHTMPNALRRGHRLGSGTWARLVVVKGRLRYNASSPAWEAVLDENRTLGIPPDREHSVEPLGSVRFLIEFLAVDREQRMAPDGVSTSPAEEGGDPPCWAHLMDGSDQIVDATVADRTCPD